MAAKGEKKESKGTGEGIQLYCGLGLVEEIVAINPTNEQKAKIYGYEADDSKEEVEYTGKNDEGDEKLSLDIYYRLQGVETPRKHRFFLENCPIEFEDKENEDKKLFLWVNQVGQLAKAASKDELSDWFTEFQEWDKNAEKFIKTGEKKIFRKCLKGEDGLMRFLREALNINYEKSSASLDYNYKKLFAGNVKELLVDLQGELFRKFVVMTQITSKEGEEGVNHYEKLWLPNNNFGVPTLPEEAMKHINNNCKFPKGWLSKKWEKKKDGELIGGYLYSYTKYPPTGYAPLEPLKEYDEAEDPAGGKAVKVKAAVSETDDDY